DLEKFGEVRRPSMGVTLRNVADIPAYHQKATLKLPDDVSEGIMIEQVVPNSAAAVAGLQEMDIIVQLDKEEVGDILELRKYLYNKKSVGDAMTVKYYREGKLEEATLKLNDESKM